RRRDTARPEIAAERDAVLLRQQPVEHDRRVIRRGGHLVTFLGGIGDVDRKPGLVQTLGEEPGCFAIVLDEEHFHRCFLTLPPGICYVNIEILKEKFRVSTRVLQNSLRTLSATRESRIQGREEEDSCLSCRGCSSYRSSRSRCRRRAAAPRTRSRARPKRGPVPRRPCRCHRRRHRWWSCRRIRRAPNSCASRRYASRGSPSTKSSHRPR